MKKSLLIAVALVSATTGFAQNLATPTRVKAQLPILERQLTAVNADLEGTAPVVRRSLDTNNYFNRPDGAFYRGWGLDGYGMPYTMLSAPLGSDVVFTELGSSTPAWKQGTSYVDDADGKSLTFNVPYASSYFYAPFAVVSRDSFCVGTNNIYSMGLDGGDSRFASYSSYSPYFHWGFIGTDSVNVLRPIDDHSGEYYQGTLYSNGQMWGSLSTKNLYGSGYITYDGGAVGDCYAIDQAFGKTLAPLYVERVVVNGYTLSSPIKNDGQLIALVTGVREVSTSNGGTQKAADLSVIYDTLYATATDTLGFTDAITARGGQTLYEGKVLFSKKEVDDFGTEVESPFIIPANTEFAVYVTGFEDTVNVDFGPSGFTIPAEDNTALTAHFYTQLRNSDSGYRHYYSDLAADVALVGMYDGALAPAHPGLYTFENENLSYNVVKISDDGQTNLTDSATASISDDQNGDGLPGAFVMTTIPFFDGDGNQNYTIDDLPDWITNVQVMALDEDYNFYILAFTADALPTGTAGRVATVHVTSEKGAASEAITLLQGNATAADGINAVAVDDVNKVNDNRIFNLAGQQVNKAYKGVVIKNGHKFIQK